MKNLLRPSYIKTQLRDYQEKYLEGTGVKSYSCYKKERGRGACISWVLILHACMHACRANY